MKTYKLSEKVLIHLVKLHKKHPEVILFEYDFIKKDFPSISDQQFINSIYMLGSDGLVTYLDGDDHPSPIGANVNAIRRIEENTFLKKGYSTFKELKELIL